MGGHAIMYCNGPLTWSAKHSKTVPQSTCEAETDEASRAAKDGMFTRALAENNGRPVKGPTYTLGDNKAMIDLLHQEGASVRTRSIMSEPLSLSSAQFNFSSSSLC